MKSKDDFGSLVLKEGKFINVGSVDFSTLRMHQQRAIVRYIIGKANPFLKDSKHKGNKVDMYGGCHLVVDDDPDECYLNLDSTMLMSCLFRDIRSIAIDIKDVTVDRKYFKYFKAKKYIKRWNFGYKFILYQEIKSVDGHGHVVGDWYSTEQAAAKDSVWYVWDMYDELIPCVSEKDLNWIRDNESEDLCTIWQYYRKREVVVKNK